MSLVKVGNVKAACRPPGSEKQKSVLVGVVFLQDTGGYAIKLDTLPLPSENWTGWLNIYMDEEGQS